MSREDFKDIGCSERIFMKKIIISSSNSTTTAVFLQFLGATYEKESLFGVQIYFLFESVQWFWAGICEMTNFWEWISSANSGNAVPNLHLYQAQMMSFRDLSLSIHVSIRNFKIFEQLFYISVMRCRFSIQRILSFSRQNCQFLAST